MNIPNEGNILTPRNLSFEPSEKKRLSLTSPEQDPKMSIPAMRPHRNNHFLVAQKSPLFDFRVADATPKSKMGVILAFFG